MPYRRFEAHRPYRLHNTATTELVCTLTGAQLDDLLDRLVREGPEDRAYWIDETVLGWLASQGADAELLGILRVYIDREGACELGWAPERDDSAQR